MITLIIIQPILVTASTINSKSIDYQEMNYQLYRVVEPINLDNDVTVLANTYLYGISQDDHIEIQYLEQFIKVESNKLEIITEQNSALPNAIDYMEQKESAVSLNLKDKTLFGFSDSENKTIKISSDKSLPFINGEYLVIGNLYV